MRKVIFLIFCGWMALAPLIGSTSGRSGDKGAAFPGWPEQFEGLPLEPMDLGERERRFTSQLPGEMCLFRNGSRDVVYRWVRKESRLLHPIVDCYRGSGFSVKPLPLYMDEKGRAWQQFSASREGEAYRVREIVVGNEGGSWSDVSAWYWSAVSGKSKGPWWGISVIERE